MTSQRYTDAEARHAVETLARGIARQRGATISGSAMTQLLRPSAAFFGDRDSVSIDRAQLRRALVPLVDDALALANPPARGAEPHRAFAKKKAARRVFTRNRRRKNPIRKDDIQNAMKRATCHYLWFCR